MCAPNHRYGNVNTFLLTQRYQVDVHKSDKMNTPDGAKQCGVRSIMRFRTYILPLLDNSRIFRGILSVIDIT